MLTPRLLLRSATQHARPLASSSTRAFASSSQRLKPETERALPELTVMPKGIQHDWRNPKARPRSDSQSTTATQVMKDRTLAAAASDQHRLADTQRINHGQPPVGKEKLRHRVDRPSAILMPHDRPLNIEHVGEHRIIHVADHEFIALVNGGIVYTVTDGKRQRTVISYARLRDACTCSVCVNGDTRQKTFRSSAALKSQEWGILPQNAVRATEQGGKRGVHVTWPSDSHQSFYSFEWLTEHVGAGAQRTMERRREIMRPVTWSGDELFTSPNPTLELSSAQNDPRVRHAALLQVQKYGYLKLTGVPTAETVDASCALRTDVAPLFGEIRNTFYGPTWDVKSVKKSRNVAYTDVDLGLHMDLLYFQNPPRFQLLHCLRNRVHGGESYFVDSFRAAQELFQQDPAAFHLLASTPIAFHYDNDGQHYRYSHPTIEVASSKTGQVPEIKAVNYSPPFQEWQLDAGPRRDFLGVDQSLEHDVSVYKALQRFEQILDAPEHQVEFTLKEGECVVFDNRRVLHARRRFWDREGQVAASGDATRWLKGCYIDGDAVWNALRYTDRKML